ncbi:hypothetical protein [Halomonas binhaiensis]|uniref:Uncharacterized protein n=1 Tax=Halomonas binhaiensis TaxID=2562282 RepID=A0A5C1ND50_9GAMM|nr:hypothetical protein [Halomonas binhaiensis]QEM80901.1 hypothetical protein E4T21_04545 [Halomonas binhaiensis]
MDPIDLFEKDIMEILSELRESGGVVEYSQVEGDEFLKFPENGFYLHSKNGTGKISDCRIYFEGRDEYFPAKISTRGEFGELSTLDDFEAKLGSPIKEVRAVKIPGASPTLPGKVFEYDGKKITVYSSDGSSVSYIHIKQI